MVSMHCSLKLKCFVLVLRTEVAHLPGPLGIIDQDLAPVDPVVLNTPTQLLPVQITLV